MKRIISQTRHVRGIGIRNCNFTAGSIQKALYYSHAQQHTVDEAMVQFVTLMHQSMVNRDYSASKTLLSEYEDKVDECGGMDSVEQVVYKVAWKLMLYRYYAMVYFNSKELDSSLQYCEKILAMEPGLAQLNMREQGFFVMNFACSQKAQILAEQKNYSEALHLYSVLIDSRLKQALEVISDDDKLVTDLSLELARRGHAYYHLGEYEKALSDLKEASKYAMQSSCKNEFVLKLHQSTANIYTKLGNFDKAIQELNNALSHKDLAPNAVLTLQNFKVNLLLRSGQYDSCIALCSQLLQENESAMLYVLRSKCYHARNDVLRAFTDCRNAHRLGGMQDSSLANYMIFIYQQFGMLYEC